MDVTDDQGRLVLAVLFALEFEFELEFVFEFAFVFVFVGAGVAVLVGDGDMFVFRFALFAVLFVAASPQASPSALRARTEVRAIFFISFY